jgi:hypothetical protein
MHTKDKLAEALMTVGLIDMSLRARDGYYHDFLSPLATPEMQLCADLMDMAIRLPDRRSAILAIRTKVIDGEFDASLEESDEWAASPEGQYAFSQLVKKK